MQHPKNPNIECVILKDGAFVVGDTKTGLTNYSFPDSPNAVRAWAKRGHHPELVDFAETTLVNAYHGDSGRRSLERMPEYHARNWVRLNHDPRKWGLPLQTPPLAPEHP